MPIHNQELGLDPENPKRQETRRRLVELNLQVGGRARAAEGLARELIRRGAKDAGAHRLLAEALEQVGGEGNAKALAESCREYEAAERLEPGDVGVAERLAFLYQDKLNDPAKALEVLDQPDCRSTRKRAGEAPPAAHLARVRYFAGAGTSPTGPPPRSPSALKADPADADVQLSAAEAANRRGDPADARRHLEAVSKAARETLRVKLIEGLIELNEQRPDEAIQSWRAGLVQTGGNNADLTWRLARVLISMGRTHEAEPLLSQYRRLVGGDEPNAFYHYLNGFALLKKDHPAEAIAELEGIRYKVPRGLEPQLYDLLGQCYERVGDTAKASEAYRQATKADARSWEPPWLAMANHQAAERLDDARRTLDQALGVNPNDPRLLVGSALILWRQQVQLPREQRSWAEVEKIARIGREGRPQLGRARPSPGRLPRRPPASPTTRCTPCSRRRPTSTRNRPPCGWPAPTS